MSYDANAPALISPMAGLGGYSYDQLVANNYDFGVLRPFIGDDGRSYIDRTVNGETKVLTANAPATLPYDAWKNIDSVVSRAVHERLSAVADVRAAGLEYRLPNGMAHTLLQYQTQGDITPATVSMDPIRRSEADLPTSDVAFLPLPVVHKDFDLSYRQIQASRMGASPMPLDTDTAALAGMKVAEEIEKMLTGNVAAPFTYAGGTIYGYTTLPSRAIKTDMTVPSSSNGATVLDDILALRQMLINDNHLGPYRLYLNKQWAQVLDVDYATAKGDNTLRQRILAVTDIQDIKILDFLPTTQWHAVLVEMKSLTVRMVIGMEVQTVQWESLGPYGMRHYKTLALIVPQLRPDADGNSGIGHGRTAT